MDGELKLAWNAVVKNLNKQFDQDLDLDGIIFLIGVQELGKGFQNFSKDQKLEVMHIAICKLLSGYGYYEFIGNDEDGWPHYERNKELPPLKPMEQEHLMKEAIVEYFATA